jgi:CRP/FNR family transcriptional regulator
MAASPAELLRTAPVFRDLSNDDRHVLARIGQAKMYRKGDIVFREGDDADHLYTVLRGKVKIYKTTPSGKEILLALLGPGAPVGAVAVYHGVPFPASAMAFEDAVLISIPAARYFELLQEEHAFVRRLVGAMTHRLMELNQRFPELAGGNVESRFARFFLKLSEQLGRRSQGGVFVPLHFSRQDLADFTGTTIETAIRIMSRWGKDGLVQTGEEGFLIQDTEKLERLAAR